MNRQVYYRSVKRAKHKQKVATQVVTMVKNIRMQMPRIGTRKLYYLLQDQLKTLGVGRDRLFAIMKANHLQIIPKRQYQITTNSHHRFKKHKNLIEEMKIERPDQVWVSDITYIGSRAKPMYLSLVTDAYSKKIVGYNISTSLNASGAISALGMAIKERKSPNKELIHHSDRGLQYCSDQYQTILKQNDIKCSMTESYDPYQNAIAERINGILKQEFIMGISTDDQILMGRLIKESINIYNNQRPHWSCHMKTPKQMHVQNKIQIKTYKKKNEAVSKVSVTPKAI